MGKSTSQEGGRGDDSISRGESKDTGRVRADTVSVFFSLLLVTSILAAGAVWTPEPVEAASAYGEDEIEKPTVVDETDRDGDGYVSSFTVEWDADTTIREADRRDLDQDIRFRETEGNPFVEQGTPKFGLFGVSEQNDERKYFLLDLKTITDPRQESKTVRMEVSLPDEDSQNPPAGDILMKEKGLEGLALTFVESDSSPDVLILESLTRVRAAIEEGFSEGSGASLVAAGTDVGLKIVDPDVSGPSIVGRARYAIEAEFNSDDYTLTKTSDLNEPIRLEEPSEDATKQLEVTSDVNGATVEVDGEGVGTTPWTGTYPVDYTERNGPVTVEVSADGYLSNAKSVGIDGQQRQSVDFDLSKNEKPLVVNATPSNSSVYIDGDYVGDTPVERSIWVEESVEVWVNNSGYTNERFEDVSPPRTIDWDFTASASGDSFGYIGPGNVYVPDLDTYDYLDTELNLEGVFWANFSYSPTTVRPGETVSFDGTLSTSLAGNITEYEWSFGDGATATGPHPSHSYGGSGRYTVNLTITTQSGNTSSAEETVEVRNSPPAAGFIPSTTSVVKGESVTFDAGTSNDPENSIVRYEWDFDGDGSTDGSGQTATNAYASAGGYTVELSVADDAGQEDTATQTVRVRRPNSPPQPSIEVPTEAVDAGQAVRLDASSTSDPDGSVQTYNWEMGDGTQTNGETVSHSYNASGTYQVTLLVADDRGEISSTTETIRVEGDGEAEASSRQQETDAESDTGGQESQQTEAESDTGGQASGGGGQSEEGDGNEEDGGSQGMPGFGSVAAILGLLVVLAIRNREGDR